jgi:hypothetical protein
MRLTHFGALAVLASVSHSTKTEDKPKRADWAQPLSPPPNLPAGHEWPLSANHDTASPVRHGAVGCRPLFWRSFREADRLLTARLRHARSPECAKPDVRMCAHPGHSEPLGKLSEADVKASVLSRARLVERRGYRAWSRSAPPFFACERDFPLVGSRDMFAGQITLIRVDWLCVWMWRPVEDFCL